MTNANQVIASIVGLSGSPAELNQLLNQLKHSSASITGRNHLTLQNNVVATLDPCLHSLGMLFVLEAQSRSGIAPGDPAFVENTSRFFKLCSATQIQMAPEQFVQLSRKFRDSVIAFGCPRLGVLPLLAALQKLQPSKEQLTPLHAEFLQLCLLSKTYSAASELLTEDIFHVDPHRTGTTPTDLFLYCYYGGMVAAGNKQYARSVELLLQSLTVPAIVANAIAVAAYKKLVLVALIHQGSMIQLPKFMPSRVRTMVEGESKAYQDLATAYVTYNADALNKCIEQYSLVYIADTNQGLVRQVAASLVKRNIQRLTSTYLTLSLTDIAKIVGLATAHEAEVHVLRMIESGDVHAEIDEHGGMVRFLEDPEQYNNVATAERMDAQIRRSMNLAAKMKSVHEAVMCDKHYLSKVTVKERSRYEVPHEEFAASQALFQS